MLVAASGAVLLAAGAALAGPLQSSLKVAANQIAANQADRATAKRLRALNADRRVKAALAQIKAQAPRTLEEQIEISQIASPSFKEAVRAADYLRRLRELGLSDAAIDAEGNVVARRKGTGRGPTLVLAAHLDTVFPEGTDVTVTEKDGKYYGRGLQDDARGLTVLLTVLRAMQDNRLETVGDVLFVGTVGEEGLGNLRGVKALFRDHAAFTDHRRIAGFISVDSVDDPDSADGPNAIISQATGSRRWSFTFQGPGGHSFENFGLPSATHAMGRAIAAIAELRPPAQPKTTFTVGVVSGGSAINAIAAEAQMQIDIRSNDAAALTALEQKIFAATDAAVVAENRRWNSDKMQVVKKLLGDRPAGVAHDDTAVVAAAQWAAAALKLPPPPLVAASTDSNVPLSLGIPAATVSGGGQGGKAHSPDEWYRPVDAWLGPQSVLLTTLALVGLEGVSAPTLRSVAN